MGNVATRCRKIADLRHFHRLLQPGELSLHLRFLRLTGTHETCGDGRYDSHEKSHEKWWVSQPKKPFLLDIVGLLKKWCPKKLWSIVSLNTPRLEVLDLFFFLLRDVKGKYILRYFDTRQMGSTIHSFSCLEVLKTLSAMPPGASFQWHPQRASCAEVIGRNRLEGCWRKHLWLKSLQG